jgi:hypothetical protein
MSDARNAEYVAALERAAEAVTAILNRADVMSRPRVELVQDVMEASVRAAQIDGSTATNEGGTASE